MAEETRDELEEDQRMSDLLNSAGMQSAIHEMERAAVDDDQVEEEGDQEDNREGGGQGMGEEMMEENDHQSSESMPEQQQRRKEGEGNRSRDTHNDMCACAHSEGQGEEARKDQAKANGFDSLLHVAAEGQAMPRLHNPTPEDDGGIGLRRKRHRDIGAEDGIAKSGRKRRSGVEESYGAEARLHSGKGQGGEECDVMEDREEILVDDQRVCEEAREGQDQKQPENGGWDQEGDDDDADGGNEAGMVIDEEEEPETEKDPDEGAEAPFAAESPCAAAEDGDGQKQDTWGNPAKKADLIEKEEDVAGDYESDADASEQDSKPGWDAEEGVRSDEEIAEGRHAERKAGQGGMHEEEEAAKQGGRGGQGMEESQELDEIQGALILRRELDDGGAGKDEKKGHIAVIQNSHTGQKSDGEAKNWEREDDKGMKVEAKRGMDLNEGQDEEEYQGVQPGADMYEENFDEGRKVPQEGGDA